MTVRTQGLDHSGNWGRFEYGNQAAYLHRSLWSGIGPTPGGNDLVVYSSPD
jgi:hypothetical protein